MSDYKPRSLSAGDIAALSKLQAELTACHHDFRYSPERTESGEIDTTLDGKPMIGNRKVRDVKKMVTAMLKNRR